MQRRVHRHKRCMYNCPAQISALRVEDQTSKVPIVELEAALLTSIADADTLHTAILCNPPQHLVHSHSVPFPDIFLHLHPVEMHLLINTACESAPFSSCAYQLSLPCHVLHRQALDDVHHDLLPERTLAMAGTFPACVLREPACATKQAVGDADATAVSCRWLSQR